MTCGQAAFALFLWLGLGGFSATRAAEPLPPKGLPVTLSALSAGKLESQGDIQYFDAYIKRLDLDPHRAKNRALCTILWAGSNWRIDLRMENPQGMAYATFRIARNSEYWQWFDLSTAQLRLSKSEHRWMEVDNLSPLAELMPFLRGKPGMDVNLLLPEEITNKSLWTEAFQKASALADVKVDGLDCSVFRFDGLPDYQDAKSVSYVCYFDKTSPSPFPVKTEVIDAHGRILQTVKMEKASPASAPFPSALKLLRVDEKGNPLYSINYSLKFKADDAETDDLAFTLDPGEAATIFDADTQTTITVPQ